MELIIKSLMLGVFATLVIDVWAVFSNKTLGFPRTNWAMVGRWLGHILNGKFSHSSIDSSSSVNHEKMIGWVFHYFIGVFYAYIYVSLVARVLNDQATLLFAWGFGLVTILSPWFIMQPCLGLGICASKAISPNMVRIKNFSIHSIYGVALYYTGLWLNIFQDINA